MNATRDIDIRSELIRKIEDLKSQLKSHEAALHAMDATTTEIASRAAKESRFYKMRPLEACRIVLREQNTPLPQDKLIDLLEASGATIGKKRGRHNIRISIEKTVATGTLIEINGLIGLPEWDEERFTTYKTYI